MRKIITIIVAIIVVCGIGGFAISSINKETKVNKVVASNKTSSETKNSKNVKLDNKKNIDSNINEETSNHQSSNLENNSQSINQKDIETGENIKVTNNKNTNTIAKQSNQENKDIKSSNDNTTNNEYHLSSRALDNLINNLYNSSWYQVRDIDKSFDKNGKSGEQLFDLIQFEVTPTTIKQKYGIDNLEKANLKAVIVKTNQPSNNIIWINIGGVDPKLEGYYDEIKPA